VGSRLPGTVPGSELSGIGEACLIVRLVKGAAARRPPLTAQVLRLVHFRFGSFRRASQNVPGDEAGRDDLDTRPGEWDTHRESRLVALRRGEAARESADMEKETPHEKDQARGCDGVRHLRVHRFGRASGARRRRRWAREQPRMPGKSATATAGWRLPPLTALHRRGAPRSADAGLRPFSQQL
jgi:hypothetical protein